MLQNFFLDFTSGLSCKEMGLCKSLLGFKLHVDLGSGISPAFI